MHHARLFGEPPLNPRTHGILEERGPERPAPFLIWNFHCSDVCAVISASFHGGRSCLRFAHAVTSPIGTANVDASGTERPVSAPLRIRLTAKPYGPTLLR